MYVLLWILGVLPAVSISVFWLAPKGSFVERHIDWVLTAVFLALLCGLVTAIPTSRSGLGTVNVAPVSWLVAWDVHEARRHLDLSTWSDYAPKDRRFTRLARGKPYE
jgi:hypothetical protein